MPSAIIRPLDIIMIRSDTHYAYYILWVVIKTVCFPLRPKINFQVKSLTLASIPVVGSSKMSNLGFPTVLKARESLLLIPPEKVLTLPPIFLSKLTDYNCFKTAFLSISSYLSR